jgi:hypothetical protein
MFSKGRIWKKYFKRLIFSPIEQAFCGHFAGILQTFCRHFVSILWAFYGHFAGILRHFEILFNVKPCRNAVINEQQSIS